MVTILSTFYSPPPHFSLPPPSPFLPTRTGFENSFLLLLLPPINDRRKQILLKAEIGMAWKPKHWGSLAAPFLCQNFPMYNPFLFAAFRRFVSFCRGKLCILHSDSEQSSSLNCVPALRNSFLFFVSLIFFFLSDKEICATCKLLLLAKAG